MSEVPLQGVLEPVLTGTGGEDFFGLLGGGFPGSRGVDRQALDPEAGVGDVVGDRGRGLVDPGGRAEGGPGAGGLAVGGFDEDLVDVGVAADRRRLGFARDEGDAGALGPAIGGRVGEVPGGLLVAAGAAEGGRVIEPAGVFEVEAADQVGRVAVVAEGFELHEARAHPVDEAGRVGGEVSAVACIARHVVAPADDVAVLLGHRVGEVASVHVEAGARGALAVGVGDRLHRRLVGEFFSPGFDFAPAAVGGVEVLDEFGVEEDRVGGLRARFVADRDRVALDGEARGDRVPGGVGRVGRRDQELGLPSFEDLGAAVGGRLQLLAGAHRQLDHRALRCFGGAQDREGLDAFGGRGEREVGFRGGVGVEGERAGAGAGHRFARGRRFGEAQPHPGFGQRHAFTQFSRDPEFGQRVGRRQAFARCLQAEVDRCRAPEGVGRLQRHRGFEQRRAFVFLVAFQELDGRATRSRPAARLRPRGFDHRRVFGENFFYFEFVEDPGGGLQLG